MAHVKICTYRWLGFDKRNCHGSKLNTDAINEFPGSLAPWNMACPPAAQHDARVAGVLARFRQLDDVVATRGVIDILRSTKFDNWQWADYEVPFPFVCF